MPMTSPPHLNFPCQCYKALFFWLKLWPPILDMKHIVSFTSVFTTHGIPLAPIWPTSQVWNSSCILDGKVVLCLFSKSIMCLSGTVSLLVNSSPLMLSSGTYKMSNSSQRTFKAMLILQQDCLCWAYEEAAPRTHNWDTESSSSVGPSEGRLSLALTSPN